MRTILAMASGLAQSAPLWATCAVIGVSMKPGLTTTARAPVVYAPGFWRLILGVVRLVPAPIFHKTRL